METDNELSQVISSRREISQSTALPTSSQTQRLQENLSDSNPTPNQIDLTASQVDAKTDKEQKATKKKQKAKVVFNVAETRYEVVRYVGRKMLNYKLTTEPEVEWDVLWTDGAVPPEFLAKMQPFQKINHFPGMYSLARKNHLGRNLMRMKKAFPENFKFFPQTYLLPMEYTEFRNQFNTKGSKVFIVKPEASCQGRGIFLTKTWENIQPGEHYVVQRYLKSPHLIDGLKYDLRLYVLLAGCDPLRIYLYDDGLGRFATENYVAPTGNNLENMCIHLTNYAINKDNPNFVFNESADKNDIGHKRSLKAVMKMLEDQGHDTKALWEEIKRIIIKTFCSVQPILAHSYRSCQPEEPYNNMCFEILGLDIILDHKLKPWLLEVNHTPSFSTDTPLDKNIKRNVIRDALNLMNISPNHKIRYKNQKKAEMQARVLTGKKTKLTPEEKQAAFAKGQQERDEWESKNCGGYEKIYPFDDPSKAEEDYDAMMKVAHQWWEEWTGTAAKRNVKKNTENENGKLPPMSFGQGPSRAKEIQNVYSQKPKLVPSAKSGKRQIDGSLSPNSRTNEPGSNDSSLRRNFSSPKTQSRVVNEAANLQPQPFDFDGVEPFAYNLVGEDEKDYFGTVIPIEEEECGSETSFKGDDGAERTGRTSGRFLQSNQKINPAKGKITPSEPPQKSSSSSKTSLLLENGSELGSHGEGNKPASFRIRRPLGSQRGNDERNKSGFGEKENPNKLPSFRRAGTVSTLQKLQEIYASGSTSATKDQMTLNEISEAYYNAQETEASVSRALEQDRKSKSSTYIETTKLSTRLHQKKQATLPPQKPTIGNGNFVTPKLFELNFQGFKTQQPPKANPNPLGAVLYGSGKPNAKASAKGGRTQTEQTPVMITFNSNPEMARFNYNKYLNI